MTSAKIDTRVVIAPMHAKLMLNALADDFQKYEAQFGEIKLPIGEPPSPSSFFSHGNAARLITSSLVGAASQRRLRREHENTAGTAARACVAVKGHWRLLLDDLDGIVKKSDPRLRQHARAI